LVGGSTDAVVGLLSSLFVPAQVFLLLFLPFGYFICFTTGVRGRGSESFVLIGLVLDNFVAGLSISVAVDLSLRFVSVLAAKGRKDHGFAVIWLVWVVVLAPNTTPLGFYQLLVESSDSMGVLL
jgi:hypothetical protein